MTLQVGQQIITIHILPNIPRSKGNQNNKIWSINMKTNTENVVEKPVPVPFIKNQN